MRRKWPGAFWKDSDPFGGKIKLRGDNSWRTVVGVARDTKYRSLGEEARPFLYLPMYQYSRFDRTLHVRASGNPETIVASARPELQALDADMAVSDTTSMVESMSFSLIPVRAAGTVLGISGIVALLLAMVGIYGVMSYSVAQRVREIGIRMALGARRTDIIRLIVGQAMTLAAIGIGIGLAAALLLARSLSILLYDVSASDPLTYLAVSGILGSVALTACYIAARRATKVDPMIALRYE